MREVIRVVEPENDKPVEFTHTMTITGWEPSIGVVDAEKVLYLGRCRQDGDMFAAYYSDEYIHIYKGHLNSGKY